MTTESRRAGVEQRSHPRAPLSAAVRIDYPTRQSVAASFCRNISVGGMFVETPLPPPVGTEVEFELALVPLGVTIAGRGEVVWTRPSADPDSGGFGLRFVEISPEDRQLVFQLVDGYIQTGGLPFDLGA
jgi:type IV pilus assembly protein PilZ